MPQETVAILSMSIGACKDLSLLLANQVAEYERKTGRAIETDYTRSLIKP